jgi:hypothetical protein
LENGEAVPVVWFVSTPSTKMRASLPASMRARMWCTFPSAIEPP